MNFLIIGCGSIGQKYIRILKSLGHQVTACDKDALRTEEIVRKYNVDAFINLRKALDKKYTSIIICTPPSSHITIALEAAAKGTNLFIEKPLSHNLDRVNELLKIVKKKGIVAMVGCNTRFLPSFQMAKRLIDKGKIGKILSVKVECGFYLPYWHPREDYTKRYSANRNLGGGVIFDDIHEIDSLHWLFGGVKEVFCFADKMSSLKINAEDTAEIFLKFKSGPIGQIHLDYLQRTYRRYYKFIGEEGVIILDLIAKKVDVCCKKSNKWEIFEEGVYANRDTMFIEQMKHFIRCLKSGKQPIKDISSARNILEIALACHESARKKEVMFL